MGTASEARPNSIASNMLSQTVGEGEFGSPSELGRQVLTKVTMSTSYATGGDTIDLSAYFNYSVIVGLAFPNGSKYLPSYVAGTTTANGKLKVIDSTTGSEVAATTDLSAQKFFLLGRGR